jgi:hypothetical protein
MSKNIYQKLLEIQNELNCPKNQFNKFGNYSYRSQEDILNAVKPLLVKYNATIIMQDKIELIGDRYYIKAQAKFIDVETGETIETEATAREQENIKGMQASQITGATSSYARKYCLNALLLIDDCKDADSTNKHIEEQDLITESQVKQLYAVGINAGFDAKIIDGQIQKKFNKNIKELTSSEFNKAYFGYKKMVTDKLAK